MVKESKYSKHFITFVCKQCRSLFDSDEWYIDLFGKGILIVVAIHNCKENALGISIAELENKLYYETQLKKLSSGK